MVVLKVQHMLYSALNVPAGTQPRLLDSTPVMPTAIIVHAASRHRVRHVYRRLRAKYAVIVAHSEGVQTPRFYRISAYPT